MNNDSTASDRKKTAKPTYLVGMGASAGGLSALSDLIHRLPPDTGMAFAVVMHLDPERESSLSDILQGWTDMPVAEVKRALSLEANHIYTITPDRQLIVEEEEISVTKFKQARGHRAPIDYFFRSVARWRERGIAVILSGGGTDGSVGLKTVKEEGGFVMVQDPSDAEHDGMPRSAIETEFVDFVAPAAELADKLSAIATTNVTIPDKPEDLPHHDEVTLLDVLGEVRRQTGHDFSRYKRATVLRRLSRRMQVNRTPKLENYLEFLKGEPNESAALNRELLIGVTTFFRDEAAFEALQKKVIPKLFEEKTGEDSVRVWVIGTSTGEEAYSLAILLCEHALSLKSPPSIQVFASDIDEDALKKARSGTYPSSIEGDVSQSRLQRFFERSADHYHVRNFIREVVLFAPHNVLRDAPFSRLDLVSCRNLMIYLQRDLQTQLHEIIHYALRDNGFLFVGSSESVGQDDRLFHAVDAKDRIFQARAANEDRVRFPKLPLSGLPRKPVDKEARSDSDGRTAVEVHQRLLEQYAPPSILVDQNFIVVHLSERAGRYLQHPRGTLTSDVLKLVRPEFRSELRSALYQAFENDTPSVARPCRVAFDGTTRLVYLSVRPSKGQIDSQRIALVIFNESDVTDEEIDEEGDGAANEIIQQLEEELKRTRDRLQQTIEDYETSNEELKSMNEEYRTTTEELETSREELQSVNEELQTVNSELRTKVEELSRAHSDLENLIAATDIGTLFLNREMEINWFTPRMKELFNIRARDEGRPLGELTHKLTYDGLADDAENVLRTLEPIERETASGGDARFLVRLRPYRSVEDVIEGVVVTFVDISRIKAAERELREINQTLEERIAERTKEMRRARDLFQTTFHSSPLAAFIAEIPGGRYIDVNERFAAFLGLTPDEMIGRSAADLGIAAEDPASWQQLIEELHAEGEIRGRTRDFALPSGDVRTLQGNYVVIDVEERPAALAMLADITEQRRAKDKIRELASTLTMAEQAERRRVAGVLHDDLQQRLYGINMKASFALDELAAHQPEKAREFLESAHDWMETAIDVTRHLTVELSPPVLKEEGVRSAVEWLASQMEELHGLRVELRAEDEFVVSEEDMRVLLFQIVRELLFNVVKHAGVDLALVEMVREDAMLCISVKDRGVGFDVEAFLARGDSGRGFGLYGAQERLRLFGGNMDVESTPDEGTVVVVRAPLSVPDDHR